MKEWTVISSPSQSQQNVQASGKHDASNTSPPPSPPPLLERKTPNTFSPKRLDRLKAKWAVIRAEQIASLTGKVNTDSAPTHCTELRTTAVHLHAKTLLLFVLVAYTKHAASRRNQPENTSFDNRIHIEHTVGLL